jgi:GNAT superfamily N-acetyltransferase
MIIKEISEVSEKQNVVRLILEALPDWFGIPEAREHYIEESAIHPFYAAYNEDRPVGFIYLNKTGKDTLELYVMGVLMEYHGKGVGKMLFEKARETAIRDGYSFLQVKTVQMGRYAIYDKTNQFYLSLGFKELEVFPSLWDERNPCQVYVMSLK